MPEKNIIEIIPESRIFTRLPDAQAACLQQVGYVKLLVENLKECIGYLEGECGHVYVPEPLPKARAAIKTVEGGLMRDGFCHFTFAGFTYFVTYELSGDDNEPKWGKVEIYFNERDDDPIPNPAETLMDHARAAASRDAKVSATRCDGCEIHIFEQGRTECEGCEEWHAVSDAAFERVFKEGGKRL